MKQTLQILGMYIGQKIAIVDGESMIPATLDGIDSSNQEEPVIAEKAHFPMDKVKLVLRPLESMSMKEREEFGATMDVQLATPMHRANARIWTPNTYTWLLKGGFDIFGLIGSGEAIDAAKLPK